MGARTQQMEQHGVNRSKFPFASFVAGRGWRGHRTAEAALKATKRDAAWCARVHGGGCPQTVVAETATGKDVFEFAGA